MATLSSDGGELTVLSTAPVAAPTESVIIVATSATLETSPTIDTLTPTGIASFDTSTTPVAITTPLPGSTFIDTTTAATSVIPVAPSLISTTSIPATPSSDPASSTSYPTSASSFSSLFVTEPTPIPVPSTTSISSSTLTSDTSSSEYYTPVSSSQSSYPSTSITTSLDLSQASTQYTSNLDSSSTTLKSVESAHSLTSTSPSTSSSPSTSASPPPPNTQHERDSGLSTGAKIGVGVGVGVVLIAALAVLFILFSLRRRRRRTGPPSEQEPVIPYFDSPELNGASSKRVSHQNSPSMNRPELEGNASDYSASGGRTIVNNFYPAPGIATRPVLRNPAVGEQGVHVARTSRAAIQYPSRPQGAPMQPMDRTELEEERRLQTPLYEMRSTPSPKAGSLSRRPIPFPPPPPSRTPHEFNIDAGFMSAERPLQIANPDLDPASRSTTPYGQPARMNSRGEYDEEVRRWNRGQLNLRRQESLKSTDRE